MKRDHYALITGATAGSGYEMAHIFAKDGFNLVITAADKQQLDALAAELLPYEVEVVAVSVDMTEEYAAFDLYNEVKAKGLSIEVLVNDAAQGLQNAFHDDDIEFESGCIQINITSLVMLTRYFMKDMILRGSGKILNIAVQHDVIPPYYQSVYGAVKAFVLTFTDAVRNEVRDMGITVTALVPNADEVYAFHKGATPGSQLNTPNRSDDPEDGAGWI